MRFSRASSTLIRTLSIRVNPHLPLRRATLRPVPIRPMSSFLGSLFGTSSSKSSNMSYPDQRTNDEWQAILNKGMCALPLSASDGRH